MDSLIKVAPRKQSFVLLWDGRLFLLFKYKGGEVVCCEENSMTGRKNIKK